MVDPAGWDEGKLPHTGHTPRYPPISVEGKEWARREMECVIGAHQDPLWAEATVRGAKGVVERWLRWVWATGAQEEDKKDTIEVYLRWLAMNASGNNIERTAQRLLWIYKNEFTNEKIEELKTLGKRLIRDANKRNPADLKAADALPLKGLLEMIEGARGREMMPIERIALDAFIISFYSLEDGRGLGPESRGCCRGRDEDKDKGQDRCEDMDDTCQGSVRWGRSVYY